MLIFTVISVADCHQFECKIRKGSFFKSLSAVQTNCGIVNCSKNLFSIQPLQAITF